MAKQIEITATILDFKTNTFTNTKGETVNFNSALARINSNVVRLTLPNSVDLSGQIDHDVKLFCEIVAGDNLKAKLRVVNFLPA